MVLSSRPTYMAEGSRPTTRHGRRHEEGSCRSRAEGEENGDEEKAGSKPAPPRRGLGLLPLLLLHASDEMAAHTRPAAGVVTRDGGRGGRDDGSEGKPSGRSLACICGNAEGLSA